MASIPGIDKEFERKAIGLFKIQSVENNLYRSFLELIKVDPANVRSIAQIPFLPIEFFKHHIIKTGHWAEEKVYLSSGTTQLNRSSHFVRKESRYLSNAVAGFERVFGRLSDWIIIAYLPGYTENSSSSLLAMVRELIRLSGDEQSGFLEFDGTKLENRLKTVSQSAKKIMVIGVAFALVDFASEHKINIQDLVILETGGMKGRNREYTRRELHQVISGAFGTRHVYSEYGMTELFSQAYTDGKSERFTGIHSLRAIIKDINDPMEIRKPGRYGVINIIDLANEDTCAFIATQDIGVMNPDGSFEVTGRLDAADLRGCNLLYFDWT